MANLYDRYIDVINSHGPLVRKAEGYRQERILALVESDLKTNLNIRVLEAGVGNGLFASACKRRDWCYTGVDRNGKICEVLGKDYHIIKGTCPPLPAELERSSFDFGYSSFVLEHLSDGLEAFEFVSEFYRVLKPGGVFCLVVPNALSLGMEFWNLDYTHRYPTARRNVTQILLEAGFNVGRVIYYRAAGFTGIIYWIIRLIGFLYSYRFWSAVFGDKPWLYSLFQYIKQDVLVFICKK